MGRAAADGFTLQMIKDLIVEYLGYEDNMSKISWFPPETPTKKEDIDDDVMLSKAVHYAFGSGAMTLFVVREDDPYLGRHRNMGSSLNDDDHDCSDDEGYVSENDKDDGNVEESANDGSEGDERDGSVGLDDSFDASDSVAGASKVDDSSICFCLGQQFSTITAFKSALTMYAVEKRRDIKFAKSDSKRVVAICSEKMPLENLWFY